MNTRTDDHTPAWTGTQRTMTKACWPMASRAINYRYLRYRPKLTIMDRKFYLARGLINGEGSLPVAITTRIGQSGRPLMSNPDSCEIISKSDQPIPRRFSKNFLMSV